MKESKNELTSYESITESDVFQMFNDTSNLIAEHNTNQLSSAAVSAQNSSVLTNNVEFWNWMGRNLRPFSSNTAIQDYIERGVTKEEWVAKQLQGKGYEWDWMTAQRNNPLKIFNNY